MAGALDGLDRGVEGNGVREHFASPFTYPRMQQMFASEE